MISVVYFLSGIVFLLMGILMALFGKMKNIITVDKGRGIFFVKKVKPFMKSQMETIPLSDIKKIHIEHEGSQNMIEALLLHLQGVGISFR